MTVSVPAAPRWSDDAPPGEKQLWRWAVEQLSDRVRVLPQVMLTVPGRGRPQEAEIGLVLLEPEHGVTVVEVKGGRMHYDGAGRWMQNGKECRDPVKQAKRALDSQTPARRARPRQEPHRVSLGRRHAGVRARAA